MHSRSRSFLLGALALGLLACGGDAAESAAPATSPTKAPATGGAPAGGAGAARGGGSVVLSGADLHTIALGLIEQGVAISGGLRPIETISIRSRIEGDVIEVIAREGDAVGRGALLARFESTEQEAGLKSAEADRLAAELDAKTAQWSFEQTAELFKAGAIPERDYRAAEQSAAAAGARLAGADARLRTATLVERDTRIVAPVSGVIERRSIERGVRAQRGAELFTLVRTDVLELTAAVPARLASGVRRGQAVRFTADGRAIEGRVARISPTIDAASQSVTVYVQVPNADGSLKGNTFATGHIIERALADQLTIPQPAVRQPPGGDGQPFVWRLADGKLERVSVRLGVVDEVRGLVQVLEGLAIGDQVVTGNVGMLGAGMQVQLIGGEAPAAPGGNR
jgi:RND family efflux transporter MFP subunit